MCAGQGSATEGTCNTSSKGQLFITNLHCLTVLACTICVCTYVRTYVCMYVQFVQEVRMCINCRAKFTCQLYAYVVWCGVVWCGVVWCGVVLWLDLVCCECQLAAADATLGLYLCSIVSWTCLPPQVQVLVSCDLAPVDGQPS